LCGASTLDLDLERANLALQSDHRDERLCDRDLLRNSDFVDRVARTFDRTLRERGLDDGRLTIDVPPDRDAARGAR